MLSQVEAAIPSTEWDQIPEAVFCPDTRDRVEDELSTVQKKELCDVPSLVQFLASIEPCSAIASSKREVLRVLKSRLERRSAV